MQNISDFDRARYVPLLALMTMYGAASLLHFVHNAIYLEDYPNLPPWLTAFGVYASWVGITLVGVIGCGVYRGVAPRSGLTLIAVYALLGFGGLDHYVVAPMSSHTVAMNATILVEVACAAVLLVFVGVRWYREPRAASMT
jgi:hypothetical protein